MWQLTVPHILESSQVNFDAGSQRRHEIVTATCGGLISPAILSLKIFTSPGPTTNIPAPVAPHNVLRGTSTMPVDYSKWDALELSDDSDIEVHPNVDKRSFIRAKQNQIHQQRYERKKEIDTLKYERIINDGLLERINALLDALKKHTEEATKRNPDEVVFQAMIESAGDPAKDDPPKAPEGVYTQQKEPQPKYSKMMGSLVDQVKKEVDDNKSSDRYTNYIDGVYTHLTKVQNLQQELLKKLAELEKEEKTKITSESIHDGFNTSHVSKGQPQTTTSTSKPKSKTNGKAKSSQPEMLNAPASGLSTSTAPP